MDPQEACRIIDSYLTVDRKSYSFYVGLTQALIAKYTYEVPVFVVALELMLRECPVDLSKAIVTRESVLYGLMPV